jgi:hypothetical protein
MKTNRRAFFKKIVQVLQVLPWHRLSLHPLVHQATD